MGWPAAKRLPARQEVALDAGEIQPQKAEQGDKCYLDGASCCF